MKEGALSKTLFIVLFAHVGNFEQVNLISQLDEEDRTVVFKKVGCIIDMQPIS